MIDYTKSYTGAQKSVDLGLRSYMLKVYNYMAIALTITGFMAYLVASVQPVTALFFVLAPNGVPIAMTGLGTISMFAPLGLVMYFSFGFASHSLEKSKTLFWIYAGLMGISLASIAMQYTGASVARTFFVTAATFGATSIYGYTTQRDLTSFGSFLMMGLFGLIIASIVNIFLQSSAVYLVSSLVGVAIFTGLIAYDTQKIKSLYYSVGGGVFGEKMALNAAFSLYLDVINLFIYLLRFLGTRKE